METFNTLNLENVKSYASIDNLENALVKNGLDNLKPILVGVPTTTRVTALFSLNRLQQAGVQPIAVIHKGFAVTS